MVFFAISRSAYESYVNNGITSLPLWVCDGLLSERELKELRAKGGNVSNFDYFLERGDFAGIQDAVETIREHHPGKTVWVGY